MTYNVVPIQIVENVHDDKHRKQTNINLANESPFGLLALLWTKASDICRSLFPRIGSVGVGHDFYIVDVALIDSVLRIVEVFGRHDFFFRLKYVKVVERNKGEEGITTRKRRKDDISEEGEEEEMITAG